MLTLRIALRYLFSKKTHNAVNIISGISVIGVAVATMAIVCVLSVFNGFTDVAADRLSILSPDLRIESLAGKTIQDADSMCGILNSLSDVEIAAPVIEEHGLAIYNNRQMPVTLKGVTPDYARITLIDSIVKEDGSFMLSDPVLGSFATLSVGAAIELAARPGFIDRMSIYVPRRIGRINTANPMSSFRGDSLLVGGVFQAEQTEFDTDIVIIPLDMARRLLDYTSQATAIEIKTTTDPDHAKKAVIEAIGPGFVVKNAIEQQEESFKMISVEKWITFFLLAFILIIASFNIISTLSMLIIEKDANIHTLYALGASRNMISRIFVVEGWLISLCGGIAGIILGVILCLAQQWGEFITLGGNHEAMTITAYPVRLEATDLIAVFLLTALIGWITSMVTSFVMRRRLNAR